MRGGPATDRALTVLLWTVAAAVAAVAAAVAVFAARAAWNLFLTIFEWTV